MLEKALRDVLRKMWMEMQTRASIHWVEPSMGSTIGMADAMLVGGGLPGILPCELKRGEKGLGGISWEVRPAQGLYHRDCYEHGVATIFLCVCGSLVFGTIGKHCISVPSSLPMRLWQLIEGPSQIRLIAGQARKALDS